MSASKFLLITFLVFGTISQEASGEARHALFKDSPEHSISRFVNPVLINDLMIYQVNQYEAPALWSYNTLTAESKLIFTGELEAIAGAQRFIHRTDHWAYFVSGEDSERQLWQTDGTAAGTRPLTMSSPAAYAAFMTSRDDTMFTFSDSEQLVSTDGQVVVEHGTFDRRYISLCPFDVNDVIATRPINESDDLEIVRSNNGQVSTVSDVLPSDFEISFVVFYYINGTCYANVNSQGNVEVLVIPKNGEVRVVSQDMDLSRVYTIFTFDNRVYAGQNSGSGQPSSVSRFNEALDGFDAHFFNPPNGDIRSYRTLQNHIIVETHQAGVREVHNLKPDLTPNPELQGVNLLFPSAVYPTANRDLYQYNATNSGFESSSLSFNIDPAEPSALTLSDGWLYHIISNPKSEHVYFMLLDYLSKRVTTYALSATPDIDQSISGIWHDPEIQNQGIAITPGRRIDGSEYLFVTVYTYKNGQPLWLAGVGEVQLGQTSVELLLASYNGLDTFEAGFSANQEIFGSLKITMTGCNTLSAELNSNAGENYALSLSRINNINYSHLCID